MNICIVSTYSCTFEDFSAIVDEYEETFKEFITEYELVKVNDHKSIMMCHCTDMEAFEGMMTSPEMKEWDKKITALILSTHSKKSISHLTPQI